MNIRCSHCDALLWFDEHVSSSRVGQPEFQTFCAHGKVMLPALQIPPAPLYRLFMDDSRDAKEFCANIVQYNTTFSFTSMGVKVDNSVLAGGPPVFRIHGELKHLSGSLIPE